MLSLGQDLLFALSGGRQKPPKHILLPYAVKSLTNNVNLIQIMNRCGSKICRGDIDTNNGRRLEKEFAMAFGAPSFQ